MKETTIQVPSSDGIDLQVYVWEPAAEPRAIVQVQHGLGEHAGRYKRFAEALTAAGYLVYGADVRGAGRTAQGNYGQYGDLGWPGWVDDVVQVNRRIRADHPDVKLVLFGHSMGSFASQHFLLDHSGDIDAVVLCGSTEVGGIADMFGADEPADLSSLNAAFEHRTGFEWLSRDEAEVDAYMADQANGWAYAIGRFNDIDKLREATDPERLSAIRDDLPILLISGTADPIAGGGQAIQLVAQRYRDAGVNDVEVILYPDARHEILNETNRDEVTQDVLEFLQRTVG
ncbi:alpha/beta hydrolase [Aestuariimicrobium ganziense]|uniref:alpha/beta hydrolase n=1 Tax=Aestuariimicrobium ganziense TaxID=2773677 RepID=UPI001944E08E|nr:alpha/beta hydrolase [Aestuariimicrobium ganziense]